MKFYGENYMNLKREVSLILVSLILLSATAIAAPTNNIVPIARFSASPLSGYAPMNVTFTDKSIGEPTSWRWTFGDGTNSTVKNPKHTYSKIGNYTVSLTVKNTKGSNTKTVYKYITIQAPQKKPVASFSASPRSGHASLNVTFTDKSTGSPTSWKWFFGDKTNSTVKNPSHIYSKKGKYPVTLIVKNKAGKDSLSRYSYINVLAPKKAVNVNSSTSPLSGNAPK
jgi:PKD repeat protein